MSKDTVRISKLLSLVLRHRPEEIGIELDPNGWVLISTLLAALAAKGYEISHADLEKVVRENDKQRFTIQDGWIRANQGHSVKVSLGIEPSIPPDSLYHGTATRFLASILESGLQKMSRQHVHLSADQATAHQVGMRHGKPVILKIYASQMHQDGFEFYRSDNGVWLTDSVAPRYLEVLAGKASSADHCC